MTDPWQRKTKLIDGKEYVYCGDWGHETPELALERHREWLADAILLAPEATEKEGFVSVWKPVEGRFRVTDVDRNSKTITVESQ